MFYFIYLGISQDVFVFEIVKSLAGLRNPAGSLYQRVLCTRLTNQLNASMSGLVGGRSPRAQIIALVRSLL